jgi:translocation and assembly module TamB
VNVEPAPSVETRPRRFRMPLRRPRWALVITGVLLLVILLITVIWFSRMRIATDLIERELARRGVQGSYRVTGIGFERQRLEDVVLGDPANPDLTAELVEVEVALGLRQTRVRQISAQGVRLRGRIVDGKVRLGELDKLLPPPTGRPFRLPNLRVTLADTQVQLDTPAGRVGLALQGRGNIAYSFEGRIAAFAPRFAAGDCRADRLRANFAVRTKDEEPTLVGPLRADLAACTGLSLVRPELALQATLTPEFDGWRGRSGVRAAELRSGVHAFRDVGGTITFDGSDEETRGRLNVAAAGARIGDYLASRPTLAGRYVVAPRTGAVSLAADLGASGLSASGSAQLTAAADALGAADGTPIEPIADALAAAIRRAGRSFDANGSIRFVRGRGYQAARLDDLSLRSRSGARLAMLGAPGLTYYWPTGTLRIDGEFALAGGGFPAARVSLAQQGRALVGEARIAPMQAGSARLVLDTVRFGPVANGTRVDTRAVLSGPFNDGRVESLVLPVSGTFGNGGFAFGERCTTISFRALRAAGLQLGATTLPLCPTGRALVWRNPGGAIQAAASVRQPRLAGRLGNTPISFAAADARFSLAEPGFASSEVAIRLADHRLDLDSLTGRFNPRGVTGTFAGGDGKLANVPLLLDQASGEWRVEGGDVLVTGGMRVSDEQDPPRFWPLRTDDFRLTLADNRIEATGWLNDPEAGRPVTQARIEHDLNAGRGQAVLDVPGIRFGPDYQPDQLTRLTTGVVALVEGELQGRGRIEWGPEGTSSTGTFSTADMNLAAPFGPVTGLTTSLEFTDLLGLVTAPGQLAQVDRIQAGIDVLDGRIRYQLLPGLRVRVERGEWPFAGGQLLLDETVLDFSQPSTKRLVFTVRGLDAAAFVQQMEFSNIAATGTFDGTIPMEFDIRGGRIVGGRLVARPEGGTLSYIGELTDKDLGYYGKLAFDALKSLRYSKLIIDLDGSLEGEFLAEIELDGIATNTPRPGGIVGQVFNQVAKIPFEFNIDIRGPFRSLIATARSFEDPSQLIQPVLPEFLRDQPTTVTVQTEESEEKP